MAQRREAVALRPPKWIQSIIDAQGGGWAKPQRAPDIGPVLLRRCFNCQARIKPGVWYVVMPGVMASGGKWIVWHRTCLLGAVAPL